MATQENGLPLNIISNFAASTSIASSTNASPIVITTSTPHGLTNGDFVSVNNHVGNFNANGDWLATVISATQLSLFGSTGNAVGGATGLVTPRSIGPTFAIPADGVDNLAAASVNTPFEALADRTAYQGWATGAFRLSNVGASTNDDDTDGAWDHFTIAASNTWTDLAGATVWQPVSTTNIHTGDIIIVDAQLQQSIQQGGGGNGIAQLQLWYGIQVPAGAPAWGKVPASTGAFQLSVAGGVLDSAPHLQGLIIAPFAGILNMKIMARSIGANLPTTWQMVGDYMVRVQVLRATGYPQ